MSTVNDSTKVNQRALRGMEKAATTRLRRKRTAWLVPSQSGSEVYAVDLEGNNPRCTCVDHIMRQVKCIHIHAVEFTLSKETKADGTTSVTETVRLTSKQDWYAYKQAQTHEGERLFERCTAFARASYNRPSPEVAIDSH